MTVTRTDLVDMLRTKLGLSRTDAKQIIDGFFDEVSESLENGEPVKLSGFGVFNLRRKRERPGRNLKTGEIVMIEPRTVVRFRAGNKLRSQINERKSQERSGDFDLIAE